jgi:hypothetical protein
MEQWNSVKNPPETKVSHSGRSLAVLAVVAVVAGGMTAAAA